MKRKERFGAHTPSYFNRKGSSQAFGSGKKFKVGNHASAWDTPIAGVAQASESPASGAPNTFGFPATTYHRLASFNLSTPALGDIGNTPKLGPQKASCTPKSANAGQLPQATRRKGSVFQLRTITLSVPSSSPGSVANDDLDEEEFFLKSSQTYTRLISQPDEQYFSPIPTLAEEDPAAPCSHPATCEQVSYHTDPAHLATGTPAALNGQDTTPELAEVQVACLGSDDGSKRWRNGGGSGLATDLAEQDSASNTQKLFPLFRPKEQRKLLCLIRHGESEYNRADAERREIADPSIFDPCLTQLGREQARALRSQLAGRCAKHGEALWVVSPLTRCIETFLLACPFPERIAPRVQSGGSPAGAAAPSGDGACGTGARLNLAVLPAIAEQLMSCGDIGRPPNELAKQFPQLEPELSGLPAHWWYREGKATNCALTFRFEAAESKAVCLRRVAEFKRWLEARPESFIVAFGHSVFWRHFLHEPRRMRNGELFALHW